MTRLRALIKDRGFTQAQVAAHCEVTQPTVQRWLGGTLPQAYEIYRLGELFGVQTLFLLFPDVPSQAPMSAGYSFAHEVDPYSAGVSEVELWRGRCKVAEQELHDLRERIKAALEPRPVATAQADTRSRQVDAPDPPDRPANSSSISTTATESILDSAEVAASKLLRKRGVDVPIAQKRGPGPDAPANQDRHTATPNQAPK